LPCARIVTLAAVSDGQCSLPAAGKAAKTRFQISFVTFEPSAWTGSGKPAGRGLFGQSIETDYSYVDSV
jgi:hypothetical protein